MSTIPTYTKEEDEYYEKLLTEVSQRIGIDKNSPDFNKNDERSRLYYYFSVIRMKNDKTKAINLIQEGIDKWIQSNEHEYWINCWSTVLEELKKDNWEILYERSDLMQQLRSCSPFHNIFIKDKERYKILKFLSKRK